MWGHRRIALVIIGSLLLSPSLIFSAVLPKPPIQPTSEGGLPEVTSPEDQAISTELHACFTQQTSGQNYVFLFTPLIADHEPNGPGYVFRYAGAENSAGNTKVILASPHVLSSTNSFWAQLFGSLNSPSTKAPGTLFACKTSTRQYILFDFGPVDPDTYSFRLSVEDNGVIYAYTVLGIPFKMNDTITGNGIESIQVAQFRPESRNGGAAAVASRGCILKEGGLWRESHFISLLALLLFIPVLRLQQRKQL